jgi:hypothetical protein
MSTFTVLILLFSHFLGTRRDPSLFEYTSTAPAAHDGDDGAFILNAEDFAPTAKELAVVEAEVSDKAFTDAIEAVRKTGRSGRYVIPSQKVVLNKAQEEDTQLALR